MSKNFITYARLFVPRLYRPCALLRAQNSMADLPRYLFCLYRSSPKVIRYFPTFVLVSQLDILTNIMWHIVREWLCFYFSSRCIHNLGIFTFLSLVGILVIEQQDGYVCDMKVIEDIVYLYGDIGYHVFTICIYRYVTEPSKITLIFRCMTLSAY